MNHFELIYESFLVLSGNVPHVGPSLEKSII